MRHAAEAKQEHVSCTTTKGHIADAHGLCCRLQDHGLCSDPRSGGLCAERAAAAADG